MICSSATPQFYALALAKCAPWQTLSLTSTGSSWRSGWPTTTRGKRGLPKPRLPALSIWIHTAGLTRGAPDGLTASQQRGYVANRVRSRGEAIRLLIQGRTQIHGEAPREIAPVMPLDPKIRAELERRGSANVRGLLEGSKGSGQGASINLQIPGSPEPLRREVEEWLHEGGQAVERIASSRHAEQIAATAEGTKWARLAFWAAVASVVVTVLFGVAGSCSIEGTRWRASGFDFASFSDFGHGVQFADRLRRTRPLRA
jgi:hypothetical protein